MTLLALLRHGPTEWNRSGRVQGRSDVPLDAEGRRVVESWTLPPEIAGFAPVASTLSRAWQTAELLFGVPVARDPRLVEMDWGTWDGMELADLRARIGDLRAAWQAGGLDFRAPGGESAREMQARLRPFFRECAAAGGPCITVCHSGVIKATYALSVGWDMTGPPPLRLEDRRLHLFRLDADGMPAPERLNIPLGAAETA
ncbi:MAG: histidine phosphatase family protein [Alphaproteobacteria bacterium]